MRKRNTVFINKKVLAYHIKNSNCSIEEIQKKVKKIRDYLDEGKDSFPTYTELEKISSMILIPMHFLIFHRIIDFQVKTPAFRTLNSTGVQKVSPNLRDTIMEMEDKQEFLESVVESEFEYAGKYDINKDFKKIAIKVRSILGIDNFKTKNPELFFKKLLSRIRELGVFVFFNSIVKNSTNRKLELEEFRGFSIFSKKAPIIFINGNERSFSCRIFTIVHEFVHLILGESDINNIDYLEFVNSEESLVNKITAEVLVPEEMIVNENIQNIDILTKKFCVTKYVIFRRYLDIGIINKEEYKKKIKVLIDKNRKMEINKIEKGEKDKKIIVSYKNVIRSRIDRNFFNYVDEALQSNKITYSEAIDIVGYGYGGYKIFKEGRKV